MSDNNERPVSREILIAVITALVVAVAIGLLKLAFFYFEKHELPVFTIAEIPGLLSDIYNYAPVPLRVAYYAWITLFILYSYAEKFDNHHCNMPRKIKTRNFVPLMIPILASFAVLNHLFLKAPNVNIAPLYHLSDTTLATSVIIIGYFVLALGFYLIYLARPAINGYWGPHLYEYKKEEHNKIVDTGIYGNFRHPIYLGQILMSVATFLLANSWIVGLFPIYVLIANFIRATREEKYLEDIFQEDYVKYKEKTGKWIPIFKSNP